MKIENTKDFASDRVFGLIAGVSGIGKTTLVKTLPDSETLIVSAENGLLSLGGSSYPVIRCKRTSDIGEVIEMLKSGVSYQNIFVDSLTEILDVALVELKAKYTKKQTFDLWDEYNLIADYIIKGLRDIKQNVFVTCLTKKEKDGLSFEEVFDFKGSHLQGRIKSYFDLCLHYRIDNHEGSNFRVLITDHEISQLAKDRSGMLSQKEKPDLTYIMNKILTKEKK